MSWACNHEGVDFTIVISFTETLHPIYLLKYTVEFQGFQNKSGFTLHYFAMQQNIPGIRELN